MGQLGHRLSSKIIDENGGTLPEGKNGIALYLRMFWKYSLCKSRYDGLGEIEILRLLAMVL